MGARLTHADETLAVAKNINNQAMEKAARLCAELQQERIKGRNLSMQLELLAASNIELSAKLEKYEPKLPTEEFKQTNREEQKLEKPVEGSNEFYFDRKLQLEDKRDAIDHELAVLKNVQPPNGNTSQP